jgi:CAAX protease family protein
MFPVKILPQVIAFTLVYPAKKTASPQKALLHFGRCLLSERAREKGFPARANVGYVHETIAFGIQTREETNYDSGIQSCRFAFQGSRIATPVHYSHHLPGSQRDSRRLAPRDLHCLRPGADCGVQFGPIGDWVNSQPKGVIPAGPMVIFEFLYFLLFLIPALIMSKIEKRPFDEYGLPVSKAFRRRFWLGLPYGFAMMTLLMTFIAAFHGFSVTGISASGTAAVKYGILYGIGFLFVGLAEEFGFRGYMQYTLASGIGFWPAAIILSILFGADHPGNPGEAKIGAFMAGGFGLLALFSLQRTGSLWFAVGMHAAFDWTETFFYGVPDSGYLSQGHLLSSTFHGANWLTGGSVGPEGSVFAFVILVLAAVGIHFMFPAQSRAS